MHPRRTPPLAAVLALAFAGACTGPALHVHNPGGHVVFVDGAHVPTPSLPFRYYGVARWDALPKDNDGRADWDHVATSAPFVIRPPASPWLFPLDLPLELLARAASGRPDTTVEIAVRPRPADPRSEREFTNAEATAVAARAHEARVAR